ncbi:MAG TPA: DUF1328 family protein [Rhizomicrobium sp.]|nr:DUF1328 family protein [Rhizomicrobium sp.]
MLGWSLTFFLLAVIAAYLGFVALAGLDAAIAKTCLFLFLILLIAGPVSGALRGQPPV